MTEPIIDQLYCTHCTYGTSALHRQTGNVRDQPFEYSTRAGSIEQSKSHEIFQRFEKQYFRDLPLPSDTPAEARSRLNARNSRWRRLVASAAPSGQLLANVVYRTSDTSKPPRNGCYFAHLLISSGSAERTWSLTDALQMWGAEFWVTEDSDQLPHALSRVENLSELPGFGSVINDAALLSFLTTPANGMFHSGPPADPRNEIAMTCAIPETWRKRSPEERQALFAAVFQSVTSLNLANRERLTIAVEPALAALLFYGVIRLLPKTGLVDQLSFSTFEPHASTSSSILTATDFYDRDRTDLLPASYRGGVGINTFNDKPLPVNRTTQYASHVLEMLLKPGFGIAAVDRMRSELVEENISRISDAEQYLAVDDLADRLMQTQPEKIVTDAELSLLKLESARLRLRWMLLGRLLERTQSSPLWTALSSAPGRTTQLLRLMGEKPPLERTEQVIARLGDCLPAKELRQFLDDPQIPLDVRVGRLKDEVINTGAFPSTCDAYLTKSKYDDANGRALLEQLFIELDASQLHEMCQSILRSDASRAEIAAVNKERTRNFEKDDLSACVAPRVQIMLACVANAASSDRGKRVILDQFFQDDCIDENDLDYLMQNSNLRSHLFAVFPHNEPFLRLYVEGVLNNLLYSGTKLGKHLALLRASSGRLPQSELRNLAEWEAVGTALVELNQMLESPPGFVEVWITRTAHRDYQQLALSIAEPFRRLFGDACSFEDVKSLIAANISGEHVVPEAFSTALEEAFPSRFGKKNRTRRAAKDTTILAKLKAVPPVAAIGIAVVLLIGISVGGIVTVIQKTAKKNASNDKASTTQTSATTKVAPTTPKSDDNFPKAEPAKVHGNAANKQNQASAVASNDIKDRTVQITDPNSGKSVPSGGESMPEKSEPSTESPNADKTGSNKNLNAPESPKPNQADTPKVGRDWKIDGYYKATRKGLAFDAPDAKWTFLEPITFITIHGPGLLKEGSTSDSKHKLKRAIHVKWNTPRVIQLSAVISKDSPPEVIWEFTATDMQIVGNRVQRNDGALDKVPGELKEAWKDLVIGIHKESTVPEFYAFADENASNPSKMDPAKTSKTFRFDFFSVKHVEAGRADRWAIEDAILYLDNNAVQTTETAGGLYTGRWSITSWPWPTSRLFPGANIEFGIVNPENVVTAKLNLNCRISIKDGKPSLNEPLITESSCPAAIRALENANTYIDSYLSKVGNSPDITRIDDTTNIKQINNNTKNLRSVVMGSVFFDSPLPDHKEIPLITDDTPQAERKKFIPKINSLVDQAKKIYVPEQLRKQIEVNNVLKKGLGNMSIGGRIYRVIIDDDETLANGKVTRGIGVEYAEFKKPEEK